MKAHPLSARGVSTSGRVINARLWLLPRPARLDHGTRRRIRLGFLSNAEIRAKIWRDVS
jgi:hypothetical protein